MILFFWNASRGFEGNLARRGPYAWLFVSFKVAVVARSLFDDGGAGADFADLRFWLFGLAAVVDLSFSRSRVAEALQDGLNPGKLILSLICGNPYPSLG